MLWVRGWGIWWDSLSGLGDHSLSCSAPPHFPFYDVGSVRAEVGRAHTLPGVVGICWPRRILVGGLAWPPCTRGSGLWEVWSHPLTLTGLSRWRVLKRTVRGSLLKASVILGVVYVGKCERSTSSQGTSGNKEDSYPCCPVHRRSARPSDIAT